MLFCYLLALTFVLSAHSLREESDGAQTTAANG